MGKMVIHKNKGEVFKCHLKIDGADVKDTIVRLCMEFSDNKNLFFYGQLQKDGTCSIDIPKLPEMESKSGKLIVEAIADSLYFKLHEEELELKNAIEVEFVKAEVVHEPKIQLQEIQKEINTPVKNETTKPIEAESLPLHKKAAVAKKEGTNRFRSFQEFIKRK